MEGCGGEGLNGAFISLVVAVRILSEKTPQCTKGFRCVGKSLIDLCIYPSTLTDDGTKGTESLPHS